MEPAKKKKKYNNPKLKLPLYLGENTNEIECTSFVTLNTH